MSAFKKEKKCLKEKTNIFNSLVAKSELNKKLWKEGDFCLSFLRLLSQLSLI